MSENKAVISKADKGNSIIIMYQYDYKEKVNRFISYKNFAIVKSDITKKLQRDVGDTINKFQQIIHKNIRWKYLNLNPIAPTIRGLVKIHKEGVLISPIINWRNPPAYKLAKMLLKKLQAYIPLPYTFNVKNTVQLMNDLTL